MFPLWKTSLKRSWLSFSLVYFLYVFSYLQFAFYLYFQQAEGLANPVLKSGYLIGIFGFLLGIITIKYIIIQNYTSELGSLETLGFTRRSYSLFFLFQYFLILVFAVISAIIVFQVVYISKYFKEVPVSVLLSIHGSTALQISALFILAILVSFYLVSRKDPLLMLKEK